MKSGEPTATAGVILSRFVVRARSHTRRRRRPGSRRLHPSRARTRTETARRARAL